MRSRGFTLLELIVALALVALVAALAVPAYFARGDVTLENAAQLLAEDLRLAQNHAAFHRAPTTFRFEGNGYAALGAEGEPLVHPRTELAFVRDYDRDAVFRGVRIVAVDLGGAPDLRFEPGGTAAGDLRVRLRFGDDERVVVLARGSGRIEIHGTTRGYADDLR